MENSHAQNAIEMYIAGQYKKLLKEGTLGIIREMVAHVIYARVWADKKDWNLFVPTNMDITALPYLTPAEKLNMVMMGSKQSVYLGKVWHWRSVFYHKGRVYGKRHYEYVDRATGEEKELDRITRLDVPVQALHELPIYGPFKIYSSAVKSFTHKIRMLTVMYRDPALYGPDEIALLKDRMEKPPQGQGVAVRPVTKTPVLAL